MRNTDTVLKVMSNRGKEGKEVKRLYRQLFKKELYQLAYSQIYNNKGATTKGTSEDTLDGMSEERIDKIIQKVKTETYKWKPVRRTYIPKSDGSKRPLGIPSGDDKLLQTAMKILLEAYYEPQFLNTSHGFRPKKGCHSALVQICQKHADTTWFIEGDIKGCFDNIDHEILLEIVGRKVKDGRFIRLLKHLMKAGYMEGWNRNKTYSGTPQGGIISPLLANVYIHELDKWVEKVLKPKYNRSARKKGGRRDNSRYKHYSNKERQAKKDGDIRAAKKYKSLRKATPSVNTMDEKYRKLAYVRYADDFLLSFTGPKNEALEIKEEIRKFLSEELKLELSEEKTLITHARTEKARFLGYDIMVQHSKTRRTANGRIWLGIPKEVIKEKEKRLCKNGKPVHRKELTINSDYSIIETYQAELRGIAQFYQMAQNQNPLNKLKWTMETSLIKTLANKYRTTVAKCYKKYGSRKVVDGRTYKVLETTVEREGKKPIVAHFGAIPMKRIPVPKHIRDERKPIVLSGVSDVVDRLLAGQCEMCGKSEKVEMHHVKKLKDLKKQGNRKPEEWVMRMAAMNRITLAVCKPCHIAIHMGKRLPEWENNSA